MNKVQLLFYILLIFIIYLMGAQNIDLMDNDATQYMTIASNMHNSGDYMTVKWRDDYNYLDKPPLLFWSSAFFFSLFGVNHFAYRLPSILITLLGVFSTYKLGRQLYSEKAGLYAAIIYATNFGVIVFNHDVRTDTMLTGFVVFAIWQLYNYLQQRKFINLIGGFVGIGLAMSTKGPLGLIIPVLALGPHIIYQKRWRDLFRPEWLLGLVIVFIVLGPMILSTYQQHGMYGIKFHFWSQSFGRITGESKWVDSTGPFFFLHTFLWSFIPWTLFALVGYLKKWRSAIKNFGKPNGEEVITLSGITLVFLAMSMANYKLPHYVYVVFPLVAIIAANYLVESYRPVKWEGFGKWIYGSQAGINILIWAAIVLSFILFKEASWIVYFVTYFALAYFFYASLNGDSKQSKIFTATLITGVALAFVLNAHFYPSLNPYQARVSAGKYLKENNIKAEQVLIYPLHVHKPTIDVYSGMLLPRTNKLDVLDSLLQKREQLYIFTNDDGLDSLRSKSYLLKKQQSFKDYQISMLSMPFLNPTTRETSLQHLYLINTRSK